MSSLAVRQFAISRRRVVPITRLLQKASFGPGEVNVLVRATGQTDEIAHFVMAITAAEAMARHVARCTGELQCSRPARAACFAGQPI
jgi:hypothetical protein